MMQDKYGDHIRIYTTESKQNVFVDCSYEDSPEKLQFRAVLGLREARELVRQLQKAIGELE